MFGMVVHKSTSKKVLDSVTRQIWPFVQTGKLDPICVNRSQTGPIVLYERGKQGEFLVKLNTEKDILVPICSICS